MLRHFPQISHCAVGRLLQNASETIDLRKFTQVSICDIDKIKKRLLILTIVRIRIKLTSLTSDARYSAVSGVCSAGLMTTVLPVVRACPILLNVSNVGTFHGTIAPTTPTGSYLV